jgi:hypothetical protein
MINLAQLDLKNILEIVNGICGVIALIIAALTYFKEESKENSLLTVKIEKDQDRFRASPNLKIIAYNGSDTPIQLNAAFIVFKHSSWQLKFSRLPYVISKIHFSSLTSYAFRNFPYRLAPKADTMVLEPYDFIAYEMRKNGIKGKIKIKGVFQDASDKQFESKTFIFDINEVKNPSNQMGGKIL